MTIPLIGMPQGAEWLIILAIVVLVFGAAKLPELARGTGQALRIFKTETKGLRDEDDKTTGTPSTGTPSTSGTVAPTGPAELPPVSTSQAQPTDQSDVEPEIRSDTHPDKYTG